MEFIKIKPVTISTLSPIHIGCDEDYVPTNFIIKDRLLYVLDMAVIAEELTDDERAKLGSFQSIGAIQQFFKSKRDRFTSLASRLIEVATDIANEYEEKAGKPTQQSTGGNPIYNLFPISRTAYNPTDASPYLPGSSLKGSMRTALLNAINNSKPRQSNEDNRSLQQRLLNTDGKFENDPLSQLYVVDAHHSIDGEPAPSSVLYAVSKKKRISERSSPELKVFLEAIHGTLEDAFVGEIRLTSNKITWNDLCNACNNFYLPQLEESLKHEYLSPMLDPVWRDLLINLLEKEIKELSTNHQGFLLRVGKHSGAESVTLNGIRHIKILGKDGKDSSYRAETTEKRFASNIKKSNGGLLPFGWIWVECCDDEFKHISLSMREKLRLHSTLIRQSQRERTSQLENLIQQRKQKNEIEEKQRLIAKAEAIRQAEIEIARQAALSAMTPNLRIIEELRVEIEKKLANGNKLKVSDAFWGGRIKKLSEQVVTSSDWSQEEKTALADMLQEWAGRLMALDAKDLRKQLKIAALRGLV